MKGIVLLVAATVIFVAAEAGAETEAPVYIVKPGDYLIKIVRLAGETGEAYMQLVKLNPSVFPVQSLYHPSHDRLAIGTQLVVPVAWAEALGLAVPTALVAPSPSPTPVVEAGLWEDFIPWILLAGIAGLLAFYLANRREVNEFVERGIREAEHALTPLRVEPVHAGPVGLVPASEMLGTQPSNLESVRVTGQYRVTHLHPDGSKYSRVASLQDEEAYQLQDGDGSEVVLKGCGNPAIRISDRLEPVSHRLAQAAHRTIRPQPEAPPISVRRPSPPSHCWRCWSDSKWRLQHIISLRKHCAVCFLEG